MWICVTEHSLGCFAMMWARYLQEGEVMVAEEEAESSAEGGGTGGPEAGGGFSLGGRLPAAGL